MSDRVPLLELREISFSYDRRPILDAFSARVVAGELLVVLGPSGCGKTTLLKIAASLIAPQAGEVLFRGAVASTPGPDRVLVFQDSTQLLPWKTARGNIEFGLRATGRSPREAHECATRALQDVELTEAEMRYPHELSGGMRQRVAIARAFAIDAPVLLLDEPFAAVDAPTRRRLGDTLRRLQDRHQPGVVFVTHDVDEALSLGDRLLILSRDGRILEELRSDDGETASAPWARPAGRADAAARINELLDLP